jgi:hypothetical protein
MPLPGRTVENTLIRKVAFQGRYQAEDERSAPEPTGRHSGEIIVHFARVSLAKFTVVGAFCLGAYRASGA